MLNSDYQICKKKLKLEKLGRLLNCERRSEFAIFHIWIQTYVITF